MELMKIRYRPKGDKLSLVIYIKHHGDKIIALDSKTISNREANFIRSHMNVIGGMDPDCILEWLKKNVPRAYGAYRTFKSAEVEIVERLPLKPIDDGRTKQLADSDPSLNV